MGGKGERGGGVDPPLFASLEESLIKNCKVFWGIASHSKAPLSSFHSLLIIYLNLQSLSLLEYN